MLPESVNRAFFRYWNLRNLLYVIALACGAIGLAAGPVGAAAGAFVGGIVGGAVEGYALAFMDERGGKKN